MFTDFRPLTQVSRNDLFFGGEGGGGYIYHWPPYWRGYTEQIDVSVLCVCPVIDHEFRHNIRELKQTTTTTATRTSPNKRFNEQNNSCARAL